MDRTKSSAGRAGSPFPRIVGAAGLVAYGALLLLDGIVAPGGSTEGPEGVANLAAHSGAFTADAVVTLLAFAILPVAVAAVAARIVGRGAVAARVASVMASAGSVAFGAMMGALLVSIQAAAVAPEVAGRISEAFFDSAGSGVVFGLSVLGEIALIALGIAVWRASLVRGWVPALIAACVIADPFADDIQPARLVMLAALLVALAQVGAATLRRRVDTIEGERGARFAPAPAA